MNRRSKAVVSLAAISVLLAGCSNSGEVNSKIGNTTKVQEVAFNNRETTLQVGYPKPQPGDYSVAFLVPVGGNESFGAMSSSMEQTVKGLGGTFTAFNAGGNVDTQVGQLEQAMAQGFDAVVVSDLDPASLSPVTAKAKAAGVKLISINLDPLGDAIGNYDSQILLGNGQMAYLLAQQMARSVPEGSTVGTIDFEVKVPGIVAFMNQLKSYADQYGLKIAGNASNPSDDIAGGEKAGTTLLSSYHDVTAVLTYNDPSAIGAAAAARSQGRKDLVISGSNGGSDGFEAVKAGRIAFTVQASYVSLGQYAAWGAYDLLQGAKVPVTVVTDPPLLITADNVSTAKTWAEQLAEYK